MTENKSRPWIRRWRRTPRGQSMVELALCLPILMVILLAVTDFGRMVAAGVVAQNAAKQAAVLASRHYMSPVACLQPQAQQLVNTEVRNGQPFTVTLTDVAPATASYAGELAVKATVDDSITFISPFLQPWGNASHPQVIHATDSEQVVVPSTTGAAPNLSGATATATRNATHDLITLTMPYGWTPATITDPSTSPARTYSTSFHLFESVTNISPSPANGCPVAGSVQQISSSPYTYSIDHDLDPNQDSNPANRHYWIVADAPVIPSPGQIGAASSFCAAPDVGASSLSC